MGIQCITTYCIHSSFALLCDESRTRRVGLLALLFAALGCEGNSVTNTVVKESPRVFDLELRDCVQAVSFVKGSNTCLVVDDGQVSLVSTDDGKILRATRPEDFSGDGSFKSLSVGATTIWVCGKDSFVRELNLTTFKEVSFLGGFDSEPSVAALNTSDTRIVVAIDTKLVQYDRATKEECWSVKTKFDDIFAVYALNQEWIALAESGLGRKYSVCLYSLATGSKSSVTLSSGDRIRGIAFSSDGSQIATADNGGAVQVCSVENGELIFEIKSEPRGAFGIAISPDNRFLAVGCMRGARLYSMSDHKLVANWNAHGWFVDAIQFSGDGSQLLTGSVDKHAALWDVNVLMGNMTYQDF